MLVLVSSIVVYYLLSFHALYVSERIRLRTASMCRRCEGERFCPTFFHDSRFYKLPTFIALSAWAWTVIALGLWLCGKIALAKATNDSALLESIADRAQHDHEGRRKVLVEGKGEEDG